MGLTALAASRIAGRQIGAAGWIAVWTVAAGVALGIGILGAALKSRRFNMPLFSGPGRKFIAGFAPAILAGAVLTAVFYRAGLAVLPGIWLCFCSAGVLSGGSASVRIVPRLGACFMFRARCALVIPGWNDPLPPDSAEAASDIGMHYGKIWRLSKFGAEKT
jgi:hypothetical protein